MTRRFRRLRDFEVTLEVRSEDFIAPPRPAQRSWLLNRALEELVDQLNHLNEIARDFVPGAEAPPLGDRSQADLSDDEIMEAWQEPLMEAMAEAVTGAHGDVLEVGFGRGVSAAFIQRRGVRSHTIVECNDAIAQRFEAWKAGYPDADIRLVHGRWQDVTDRLATYDGIFFHTYPLDETEYLEQIVRSTTFAEQFFPTASRHLRPGGVFTYLTNEIDSLSRAHQRLVFRHFDSITLRVVGPLDLPRDVKDSWWANSMVVIRAVK